ncbi:hypothetical protein BKA80DRAFT_338065 [Phyllosticta citrichinensis]
MNATAAPPPPPPPPQHARMPHAASAQQRGCACPTAAGRLCILQPEHCGVRSVCLLDHLSGESTDSANTAPTISHCSPTHFQTPVPDVSVGTFVTARQALFEQSSSSPIDDRGCLDAERASSPCLAQPSDETTSQLDLFLARAHFPRSLTEHLQPLTHSIRRQAPRLQNKRDVVVVGVPTRQKQPWHGTRQATPRRRCLISRAIAADPCHPLRLADCQNSYHYASPHREPAGFAGSYRRLRSPGPTLFASAPIAIKSSSGDPSRPQQ